MDRYQNKKDEHYKWLLTGALIFWLLQFGQTKFDNELARKYRWRNVMGVMIFVALLYWMMLYTH